MLDLITAVMIAIAIDFATGSQVVSELDIETRLIAVLSCITIGTVSFLYANRIHPINRRKKLADYWRSIRTIAPIFIVLMIVLHIMSDLIKARQSTLREHLAFIVIFSVLISCLREARDGERV